MTELNHEAQSISSASKAAATRRAYQSDWRQFKRSESDTALPVPPETVANYLANMAVVFRPSTVRRAASAIAWKHGNEGHPSPCDDPVVRAVLAGHARMARAVPPSQADPIDLHAWEQITAAVEEPRVSRGGKVETPKQAQIRALEDVCIIGIMRDAMLRRAEAARIKWRDLKIAPDLSGRLTIHFSKTDQEGRGHVAYVSADVTHCLMALRTDRDAAGSDRMFGLSGRQICRRIQAAAEQAGLSGQYSGHSPRIGMAHDLARSGTDLPALMQVGRWKTAEMPARYTRSIRAEHSAVAKYYKGLGV